MSYLVEALRKAEHERRQGLGADVAALSAHLPHAYSRGPSLAGWGIAVLAVSNLLLFGYLLWPRAQLPPMPAQADPVVAETGVRDQSVDADVVPRAAEGAGATATSEIEPQRSDQLQQLYAGHPVAEHNNRKKHAVQAADPPAVQIQGHLFSANPAESFVLIDGRIYHEGEHLANGVGIMRIDDRGALLDFQGQRFHVNGPG